MSKKWNHSRRRIFSALKIAIELKLHIAASELFELSFHHFQLGKFPFPVIRRLRRFVFLSFFGLLLLYQILSTMNATFVTTLSTQELQELIEGSVKKAVNQQASKPDPNDDELLDTKEAAELIRYQLTSVYGLVKRKKIPFCKREGKLLFSRKKLMDWISGREPINAIANIEKP